MTHYSLPGLPLVSAREVLYLGWILEHQIVGKVKFWDSRRCPDLRRKQKTNKTFWYYHYHYHFIYLFIYLFIFWRVHFCIKFTWDFFIFISILIKNHQLKQGLIQGPFLLLNKHFLALVPFLPALLLAPFFARSLTPVPRSLLWNRKETLATQVSRYRAYAVSKCVALDV